MRNEDVKIWRELIMPLSPAGTETLSIKLLQKTSSAQGAMFSLEILKLS